MAKTKIKRHIHFEGTDKTIEIGKAVCLDLADKEFLYLEKMKDGKWRITWTKSLFDDLSEVDALKIIREE